MVDDGGVAVVVGYSTVVHVVAGEVVSVGVDGGVAVARVVVRWWLWCVCVLVLVVLI